MPVIQNKLQLAKPLTLNFRLSLVLILFFSTSSSAQKEINPKIDKSETEVALLIFGDFHPTVGVQLAHRFSVIKKLKIGSGILYGANIEGAYDSHQTLGYGAVFADALQLLGKRQRWGLGGQIGKGIYNRDIGFDKIKGGIYYSFIGSYRSIVSKKLLLTTSLFIGHRNFHYDRTGYSTSSHHNALAGLKFGIIF